MEYALNIIFQKPRWGKIDDIAYTFVLNITSSKTLYKKP
jgi:hypothetical protein